MNNERLRKSLELKITRLKAKLEPLVKNLEFTEALLHQLDEHEGKAHVPAFLKEAK